MSIFIATININGLRDDEKRRPFLDWLISKKINAILFSYFNSHDNIRPKSSELITLTVASISYNKTPTPRDALTPLVELSDIYLYICYFFLSHEVLDHNITLYLFMSCQFLLQL
jgi:hypothetical protein